MIKRRLSSPENFFHLHINLQIKETVHFDFKFSGLLYTYLRKLKLCQSMKKINHIIIIIIIIIIIDNNYIQLGVFVVVLLTEVLAVKLLFTVLILTILIGFLPDFIPQIFCHDVGDNYENVVDNGIYLT